MKKKLFTILLSIVMVVGLLPVAALAADPTTYDIWVDGVQVTSENKDNLCGGTVSYDPTTHTLSLNNATLDNDTMSDYGIKTIIPNTLKIRLTGTNSITRTSPGGGMGIAPNSSKKDEYKDFSAVEAAVNAVVRDKNITEQTEVDAMAKAIEDAINALEKKPAEIKPEPGDKPPQTGDTSNLTLWIALLFVSGGAAVGTTIVSRRKKV